mmetsp:Transcript_90225/g.232928  ORF Transcript_90225/g.232928 Transcript_90225/m.232928 type:complete len:119 (+) Transcript_90225:232-588(+)
MGEEVKIRLIFANDVNTKEISAKTSTAVKDLKAVILEEHWPSTLPAKDTVARLRLFAGGRELGGKEAEDAKMLQDAKPALSQTAPTPVHVQPVLRSADSPPGEREGSSKPAMCFCTVL